MVLAVDDDGQYVHTYLPTYGKEKEKETNLDFLRRTHIHTDRQTDRHTDIQVKRGGRKKERGGNRKNNWRVYKMEIFVQYTQTKAL